MLDINEIQKISHGLFHDRICRDNPFWIPSDLSFRASMTHCFSRCRLTEPYKSLGLLSSRTGAAGQINAADEAVNLPTPRSFPSNFRGIPKDGAVTETLSSSAATVSSDVRRAVEIALEYTEKYAGELYISEADIWNSPILPALLRRLTWHLNVPDWKPLDSSAVPCCNRSCHGRPCAEIFPGRDHQIHDPKPRNQSFQ